jgi:hypothetical protein
MERLFSPCTRYRDLIREELGGNIRPPRRMQELKLNVSTDEFLRAERGFTYADLCTMLENEYTLAWLTPHVAIGRGGAVLDSLKQLNGSYCFHLHAEDIKIHALACSSEHLSEICDVVLRLMAASVVHSPLLSNWNCFPHHVSINAASVEYLMEQCQSLKVLTLQDLEIDEDQIRLLEEFSRPGLEIELKPCGISGAAATVLAQVLRRSVLPYLETNSLRPRIRAIQKSRPNAYRAKVLGRALLAARTNANRMWMLLSGNPEVAFPSVTATTTVAANLSMPTTATAAATSNLASIPATYCYRYSSYFYNWCLCCCSRVTTAAVTDTATQVAPTTGASTACRTSKERH